MTDELRSHTAIRSEWYAFIECQIVTLVEFLAPLKNGSNRDKCAAVLYFKSHYERLDALTAVQVGNALVYARVPKAKSINVADVLNKSGAMVNSPGAAGSLRSWQLTPTGEAHVREILRLPESQPEMEHTVGSLETLAAKVGDAGVREYIQESIRCLRFDALRPAVVFLWAGAVSALREKCMAKGTMQVSSAVRVHDVKAREIKKADDFAYIKESVLLLAAERLGILDKNERSTLSDALDLRNKCGHPTKYSPGILKASSFVEDVTGIVFR
jgi:hypothetical protein